jgi:hypothetical protein
VPELCVRWEAGTPLFPKLSVDLWTKSRLPDQFSPLRRILPGI